MAPQPPALAVPDAPGLGEAITLRTCSRTLAAAKDAKARANIVMLANVAQATCSVAATNALIAAAVLEHDTGESLKYRQVIKHPKYQKIWSSSYAKELGRLCQGFRSTNLATQPVDGTDTFHVIDFADILH
jgi:hypothetical protein